MSQALALLLTKLLFLGYKSGRFLSGLFVCCLSSCVSAHSISVFMGAEHWLYQEFNTSGAELNREQGWLPGAEVAALWQLTGSTWLSVQWMQQQGALDYIGATQAGTTHITRTDETTRKYRISWRFIAESFYIGAGIQQFDWDREIRAENGVLQLHDYYHWLGPVLETGFIYQSSDWGIDVNSYAGWWLQGDMRIDLQHVGYGNPIVSLPDGYEAGVNLQFNYQLNEHWFVLLKHQQGWRYFPASDYVSAYKGFSRIELHEPESRNHFQGYWLGVQYHF